MKNVILPRLLVLFYLFLSLSKALATPTAIYVSVEQEVLSNTSLDRRPAHGCSGAASSLPITNSLVEPGLKDSAKEFISGKSGETFVYERMVAISERYHCDWIGGLVTLAHVDTAGWSDADEWTEASRALARIARNEAIVILGQTYNDKAVWNTIELPILKNSKLLGRVTKINRYTLKDKVELELEGPVEII
ncbi:hypothetical protein EST38_g5121 [Candolleomyces aberdarensis]|uniref:Uncharacterized protein n=1 Tax=Candolleomyces aberdarensis TaxID=2316362 RepID=A0A4Q2DNI4_9AGAR|nr:hypothetical protein EST38_g5121 [Candolleomyces aberdarensis]